MPAAEGGDSRDLPQQAPLWYADLHIHSRYSRATSPLCTLKHLAAAAQRKGIALLGTGDFTHPGWMATIRDTLEPAEPGLFRLAGRKADGEAPGVPNPMPVRFMLTVEIATIHSQGGRVRRVHHVVCVPDLDTAEALNRELGEIGNLNADGRPMLGLSCRNLLEIVLECGARRGVRTVLFPAHIWTPWYAALGSKSGFDSLQACYGDLVEHIFCAETGLSSDPAMNRRLSSLDRFRMLSFSDAHSPEVVGREATRFSCTMNYDTLFRAVQGVEQGFEGTVELFPEHGKYYLDGHRKCDVCWQPVETRKHEGRCPQCGKPVTVGVLNRIEALADRRQPAKIPLDAPFRALIPLRTVVAQMLGMKTTGGKRVQARCRQILSTLGPELPLLDTLPIEEISRRGEPALAEMIGRMRRGQVARSGGYDGLFGTVRIDEE
ncbi:MAG: DNA helicase UvrD [Magnetococcales bacterium]|nr:DNA helicase UvrD [Magnetococcales bacterium]